MNLILNLFHKHAERVVAFVVFLISLALYSITLSPSVSLWDCGEFILCSRWLEVGHPPGAPLYILIARFFSMFASSPEDVAWCVNMLSALTTAISVALTYMIGIYLMRWVNAESGRKLSIVSSAIGAMSLAVCDTVWFSAVEAEVYAMSLFFTTLTIYLLLRWRETHDMHLLALIPLVIGLSSGVHLLNMLVIPAVVVVVYLEYHSHTAKHIVISALIGFSILAFVVFGLIANGLAPAMILEMIMCVSGGWPLHTGLAMFVTVMYVALFVALFYTRRMGVVHYLVLSLLLFSTGYFSNAYIIIRSAANPTINLNQPDNVFALNSVINREQYGDRPFFYGQWYGSRPSDIKSDVRFSVSDSATYETSVEPVAYIYPSEEKVFFPRMYSSAPHHKYGYEVWAEVDTDSSEPPSLYDQIVFFVRYQINHMYVRYLMWNFVGRQNDVQGIGNATGGNWISGIPIIDSYLGQRQVLHPDERLSGSRCVYYMLPFILGILGMCCLVANSRGRYVVALLCMLFVLMGPAIAFYLNQQPFEPRERDYAYAGSFMVFCLFITFGAMYAIKMLMRVLPSNKLSFVMSAVAIFMAVPMLMFAQNYRSHNRSGRTFDLELAKSYLSLCEPNAILFTEGDNDTFPLWYVQEVEGYRRDVRVVNYGLLGAEWYKRQMAKPHRGAEGVDFKNIFCGDNPVYVIPQGEAVKDFECEDYAMDLGLVARIQTDTVGLLTLQDRINLFLDSISLPSASAYYQSYDVVNTLERMRYRQLSCQVASDAIKKGSYNIAEKILKRSLDVYPIKSNPLAKGNVELAMLMHQSGCEAEAKQVMRMLATYYIECVNYYMADSEDHIVRAMQGYQELNPFALRLKSVLEQTGDDDILSAIAPYIAEEKEKAASE